MARRAIITARLNLSDFLRFWLISLATDTDVYFNERHVSRLAIALASRCRRFYPAHLDFNQKNKDGEGLLYQFQETINTILETVIAPAQSLPKWLISSLFWEARSMLEYEIVFIESARYRAEELRLRNVVFYGISTPFFRETRRFYARQSVVLRALLRFPLQLKIWASPFANFLAKKSSRRREAAPPAVWVEYTLPRLVDHAFWRKYLHGRTFEIVYYLDRADTPATKELTRLIEADGGKWIDLHAPQMLGMSGLGFFQLIRTFWSSLAIPRLSGILKALLFKHQIWHAAYANIFRKENVKLLIQHQDRSWTQCVQAHAIEQAGGIMLGYHWSNLIYCMKDWFATAQHVFFVWGKTNYEAIVRKGNTCRHILPSGLWISESETSEELRDFAKSAGFKFAVFDIDVSYDLWQSPRTLADFFTTLIGLLKKHQDWKALFKFKSADISLLRSLPGGASIGEQIAAWIDEKRICIARPDFSPITAGKIVDLCVCYSINSAGICAQIRGAYAVHWDPVGVRYPLIRDEAQKIIFSTLGDLARAIEQFAAGDKSVGDLSRWRALFDHFEDTKAGERVAEFIQDYMEATVADPGTSALTVSDTIAEKYKKQYGIGREFYEPFTFWI